MSNSENAEPRTKPTPLGRPINSTTSTIFQTMETADRELRYDDMTQPREPGELKGFCHFVQFGIERTGTLAHHDDHIGQLVDGNGQNRRGLVEADPDVVEN